MMKDTQSISGMTNKERIDVRNGGLKLTDSFYLGGPLAFLYLSIKEEDLAMGGIGIAIASFLFLYFAYQTFLRLKSKEIKLEFSDFGIIILDENLRLPWTEISEVEISRGNEKLLDFMDKYLIITIETKSTIDVETIDVSEYTMNDKQILEYCKLRISQNFDRVNNSYCG
jgi:hypothetical protein